MKAKLGSGARFAAVKESAAKGYMNKWVSPAKAKEIGGAVAAKIGIEKYVKARFQKFSEHGKKTTFAGKE